MATNSKMSYSEMVDSIVTDLDKIYGRIGGLRDFAEGREKDVFNDSRGKLGDMAAAWRRFRNSLPAERGDLKVGNWKD